MSLNYEEISKSICRRITAAKDGNEACVLVVDELDARLPHYDWVGIYFLTGQQLKLGPFRGEPSPHTQIPVGEGICGAAATAKKTIVVDDVQADPRYLACSIKTHSEIVVPLLDGSRCLGEIDIDSHTPQAFTAHDQILLVTIASELALRLISEGD